MRGWHAGEVAGCMVLVIMAVAIVIALAIVVVALRHVVGGIG